MASNHDLNDLHWTSAQTCQTCQKAKLRQTDVEVLIVFFFQILFACFGYHQTLLAQVRKAKLHQTDDKNHQHK